MVNINKLKGKMREKNITQENLADFVGVSKSTISRKFKNNGNDFSIEEAKKITEALGIDSDEAMEIFFDRRIS